MTLLCDAGVILLGEIRCLSLTGQRVKNMFLDLRRPRSVLTPSQSGYCWLGLKKMQVCRDRNLGAKI